MLPIPCPEFIKAKRHFEAWRRNRPKRSLIPDRLWELAASQVQQYGLNRVSREFRVNYTKLKGKSQELGMDFRKPESIEPSFVELAFHMETPTFPGRRSGGTPLHGKSNLLLLYQVSYVTTGPPTGGRVVWAGNQDESSGCSQIADTLKPPSGHGPGSDGYPVRLFLGHREGWSSRDQPGRKIPSMI
jgi:hypothetical protein